MRPRETGSCYLRESSQSHHPQFETCFESPRETERGRGERGERGESEVGKHGQIEVDTER